MGFSVVSQITVFIYSFLLGLGLGLFYDFFRVSRILIRTHPVAVFIEDILFFLLSAVSVFVFTFIFNFGKLRLYIVLAVFSGILFWLFTAGSVVVYLISKIVSGIKMRLKRKI